MGSLPQALSPLGREEPGTTMGSMRLPGVGSRMSAAGQEGGRARGEGPAGVVPAGDPGTPGLVGALRLAAAGRQHSPPSVVLDSRPHWG